MVVGGPVYFSFLSSKVNVDEGDILIFLYLMFKISYLSDFFKEEEKKNNYLVAVNFWEVCVAIR